jgi:hypothetical protein
LSVWAQKNKKKAASANAAAPTDAPTYAIDYRQLGTPFPDFRLVTMAGKTYTNQDLSKKGNIFVMLFNPTCGHCEDQAKLFREHIDQFKNTQLFLVAGDKMKEYLQGFVDATSIGNMPQMILGIDSAQLIDKAFIYQGLPQINIYNAHHVLQHIYTGNVPMDTLQQYLQ